MGDPVQKMKPAPESYSPKKMPEILNMMEQQATSASDAVLNPVSGGEPPRLSDIRPLLDGMKGHNYALPDCIKFIAERLGEYEELNFWNIAAVCGDSITQVYQKNPTTGCEYCVSGYLAGAVHIAYVCGVLGLAHQYVPAEEFNQNKVYYLRQIIDFIKSGVPVLVKTNLRDVPAWKSDVGTHCMVVGYDHSKNVLELLVHGTTPIAYEITDANKLDFIFIGPKKRAVTPEDIYLQIIRKMPDWLTLPARDGMYFGPAAYRAWADDIDNGRFAEKGLPLWENYGVYVCNLATNGDASMFHLQKLAALNPRYAGLSLLHQKISELIPTEHPDGSGKSLLWMELDHLGGGMDMKAVGETMRDREKRAKVSAALRDYANRLDTVVELLKEAEV